MKDPQTYTEAELVQLLKQHEQAAFGYLYDNYAAALNGVIINIVQDPHIAGDVLQEVFVKIWRQLESYDPSKGRLFTWMHNIARNAAIDITRSKDWQKMKRSNSLTEDYAKLPDSAAPQSVVQDLRKMVQTLKEEYKVLVDLSYFQGYTQEEIAKMLSLPLGTVKTRLRVALSQLKQQILI